MNPYNPEKARYALKLNAILGIPEEQTALAIAKSCGFEEDMQTALKGWKAGGSPFRRSGKDLASILDEVCIRKEELCLEIPSGCKYVIMPKTDTYALGVHALRKACEAEPNSPHPQYVLENGSVIYRSLTFKENIVARWTDESLFAIWQDSCTGIAYKKKSSEFKIIIKCPELITIQKGFKNDFIPADYDEVKVDNRNVFELDRGEGIYNQTLTEKEVLKPHQGWLALFGNDQASLEKETVSVFKRFKDKYNRNTGMNFWLRSVPYEDQLRALFVGYFDNDSNAFGDGSLNSSGSFLRVAQP